MSAVKKKSGKRLTKIQLSSRLQAYRDNLASRRSTGWKQALASWPAYAAVAGSALAMASNASATVIYSGPLHVTGSFTITGLGQGNVGAGLGTRTHKDVVHGIAQSSCSTTFARPECAFSGQIFTHQTTHTNITKHYFAQASVDVAGGMLADNNGFLKRLQNGDVVGPGLHFGSAGLLAYGTRPAGFHPPATTHSTNFFGFEKSVGGVTYYGWLEIEVSGAKVQNSFVPAAATLLGWAYNDGGGSIQSGEQGIILADPSQTPEPSSLSLAILAAGAAGVLALRRARKKLAA